MKKVTIVLPVYNGEKTIKEAIESILNQTYENFELIIVNDFSNDNTLKVINQLAEEDSRIKIINNKKNERLPNSLNIGFAEAGGDYFTWTSDDNLYHDFALEEMVNLLESNVEYGMVYCDYSIIDEKGTVVENNNLPEPCRLIYENVIGACFLYRKEVALKVGEYDPKMFLAEDYDYWLRMYKKTKIYHLPITLYYYRHHPNSLTATRNTEIVIQTRKMKLKNIEVFKSAEIEKNTLYDGLNIMLYNENGLKKINLLFLIIFNYPLFLLWKFKRIWS